MSLENHSPPPLSSAAPDDDEIDLGKLLGALLDNKWLIAGITALLTAIGGGYAFLARPVYEANVLLQVENSSGGAGKGMLAEAAAMFDVKTEAAAEIEVLRSRMIIGKPVDDLRLHIDARPAHFPLLGNWIARRATTLSEPGLLGIGGYAWGTEAIEVSAFEVPESSYGRPYRVVAKGAGTYTLHDPVTGRQHDGTVGAALKASTASGNLELLISRLEGKPGTAFDVVRSSRLRQIQDLQQKLRVSELGKRSGMINITLQGTDPLRTVAILNTIGSEYVRQNTDRKSEEAEKTLSFLERQLPELKKELEAAEAKYNAFRNSQGTISLGDEARALLGLAVQGQTRVAELRQKRLEATARFQPDHSSLQALDSQLREANAELERINRETRRLPLVEQDALRLTRDMKVSTDLYASLLQSAQQLKLVKAGKVGNVRLIDPAVMPERPVQPKKPLIAAISLLLGLMLGVATVLVRRAMHNAVESPEDVENATGLSVYATVPQSPAQYGIDKQLEGSRSAQLLARANSEDFAVESLRGFVTALQFAMLGARNNIVLLTGPTPSVGKSFISANFAAVLANSGKRVLLIDGDLRKGYLNKYFDTSRDKGFSELVAGSITPDAAIRREVLPNMDFMPTGTLPPNPSELLRNAKVAEVFAAQSALYDLVLIDSAPVLPVSDTAIIAPHAGAVILVVRDGQSAVQEVVATVKRLAQVGVRPIGAVFNGMKPRRGKYGYGYAYGYGQTDQPKKRWVSALLKR